MEVVVEEGKGDISKLRNVVVYMHIFLQSNMLFFLENKRCLGLEFNVPLLLQVSCFIIDYLGFLEEFH